MPPRAFETVKKLMSLGFSEKTTAADNSGNKISFRKIFFPQNLQLKIGTDGTVLPFTKFSLKDP